MRKKEKGKRHGSEEKEKNYLCNKNQRLQDEQGENGNNNEKRKIRMKVNDLQNVP